VREAVGKNYNLASAAARVRQAGARVRTAGAGRFPRLDITSGVSRSQRLRGAQFQTVRANQFNLGLDLGWELDLWGRLANLKRSAVASLQASAADYHSSRLSLAADVAKTALDIVEAEKLVTLIHKNLASLETNLHILDRKLELGDADDRTALEVSLSRAEIARSRANITAEKRRADASRRRLEILLGSYPEGELKGLVDFPKIRRPVPAGLPSELLLRRPDIAAAERRASAALEDVIAARKALLPSIRITGGGGTNTTQDLGNLLDLNNLVWDIAGGLTAPVFRGGELRAGVALSEAQRDEIVADYASVALRAFQEVETTLTAEGYLLEQQAQLEKASRESVRAEELALGQYEKGLVDIITVLESERRSFDARSALLMVTNQRLQNRIDLYLALGGDFDHTLE